MTHANRGRLTVDTKGKWRLYTTTIPANSTALGTVTRDESDTGALVRLEATGAYVQVNAGAVRTLDGRKVAAALGTAGRPAEMEGGKRRNVYLDDATWQSALELGAGNASVGIRTAIAAAGAARAATVPYAVMERIVMQAMTPARAWREHLGLQIADVAPKAGIAEAAYAKLEETEVLAASVRAKIAAALGLSPHQLELDTAVDGMDGLPDAVTGAGPTGR